MDFTFLKFTNTYRNIWLLDLEENISKLVREMQMESFRQRKSNQQYLNFLDNIIILKSIDNQGVFKVKFSFATKSHNVKLTFLLNKWIFFGLKNILHFNNYLNSQSNRSPFYQSSFFFNYSYLCLVEWLGVWKV